MGSEANEDQSYEGKIIKVFLLCFFLGIMGAHRFYLNKKLSAIIQLFTLGGFLLWWFYDLLLITFERFTAKNNICLKWDRKKFGVAAGFKIRLCAYLIDVVVIFLLAILIDYIFFITAIFDFEMAVYFFRDLNFIIFFLYNIILTSSKIKGTLGKYIVGICVVNIKERRLNFIHAIARFICYIFSYITLFFGFFMVCWTKNKIAFHDLIAGTKVVYNNKLNK